MCVYADRRGGFTQQLHGIVLVLHLLLCHRGGGAVHRVEGVLGQHGGQQLLVMLLLLPQPFALGFHLQAGGGKHKVQSLARPRQLRLTIYLFVKNTGWLYMKPLSCSLYCNMVSAENRAYRNSVFYNNSAPCNYSLSCLSLRLVCI